MISAKNKCPGTFGGSCLSATNAGVVKTQPHPEFFEGFLNGCECANAKLHSDADIISSNMNECTPLLQSHQGSRLPTYTSSTTKLYSEIALSSETRCIRLLDLQAAPLGLDSAPLTARVRVAFLDDRPDFSTLSYVWGSPGSTRPWHQITLLPQRVNIAITKNCFHALHRIRSQVGAVTIWVDSICINQEDETEMFSQIPLMLDIYSLARVGYNWLGESSDELNHAIRSLKSRATISARLPLVHLVASSQEQREHEWKAFISRLWKDALSKNYQLEFSLSRNSIPHRVSKRPSLVADSPLLFRRSSHSPSFESEYHSAEKFRSARFRLGRLYQNLAPQGK